MVESQEANLQTGRRLKSAGFALPEPSPSGHPIRSEAIHQAAKENAVPEREFVGIPNERTHVILGLLKVHGAESLAQPFL